MGLWLRWVNIVQLCANVGLDHVACSCVTLPVWLFEDRELRVALTVTSASGFGGLLLNVAAWLPESAAEHGFVIRPFVLLADFFCGISSCQLSSPAHPFDCTDLRNPPCICRLCQTLRRVKTIVLVCLRRQNLRLRHAFSPQQKLRGQSRPTDFLLPLLLCLFFQIGSESSATKWLRTLISLTHRWRKGPRPRRGLLKTRWNRL